MDPPPSAATTATTTAIVELPAADFALVQSRQEEARAAPPLSKLCLLSALRTRISSLSCPAPPASHRPPVCLTQYRVGSSTATSLLTPHTRCCQDFKPSYLPGILAPGAQGLPGTTRDYKGLPGTLAAEPLITRFLHGTVLYCTHGKVPYLSILS